MRLAVILINVALLDYVAKSVKIVKVCITYKRSMFRAK